MKNLLLILVIVLAVAAAVVFAPGGSRSAQPEPSTSASSATKPSVETGNGPSDEMIGATSSRGPGSSPENLRQATDRLHTQELCVSALKGTRYLAEHPEHTKSWIVQQQTAALPMSEDERRDVMLVLASLENMLANVEAAQGKCTKDDPMLEDGSIYEAALTAATLGDRRAAGCYVSLSYAMPKSMRDDPGARLAYLRNARLLIDAGIARGDWLMTTLALAAENGRDQSWIGELGSDDTGLSAERRYGLLTLQSLGANDAGAKAQYVALADSQRMFMAPQQIERGQAWARAMFAKQFVSSKPYDPAAPLCPRE